MMPERTESWTRRERAAAAYCPKRIRLLLIGESPPSDERSFYLDDASGGDPLFEEVCEVLFEARPEESKAPFLKELRRRGVFVIDLKPDAPRRGEPLAPYVGPLLINLGILSPEKIVFVHPEVYDAAAAKLAAAELPVVEVRVPAPSTDHPETFRQKLRQALVRAGLEKLIRPMPAPKAGGD
ncbi:MAG: hypothetical protein E6K80_14035 [Candidatus Eisenbacteria bacterium]|uniref:Uncharacterized protein n=1 Tax=Eiseniibacteriota bacterium TaxID=2212470 RepID=A0A538TYT7_UNCEI|nr:MAG: hypothetical protein E6K80_14035 [Candidatus Eisenbacteria bacterium]